MSLVEVVCHSAFLALNPKDVVGSEDLRKNGEWTKWPRTEPNISEPNMEEFIKVISEVVKKLGLSSIPPRHWSSIFHKYPISDKEWGIDYKPDLVLLDRLITLATHGEIYWKDIVAVMEIKSSKSLQKEAERQIARYAQCIFNAQPGRRFVLALTIIETEVTLWIFDRSGAVSCEPFDIHEEPEKFVRIILASLYFDKEQLGYDHTIYHRKDEEGRENMFIKVAGIEYKVKCIYHEPGIKGRGTVCYHGETVDTDNKSHVVIKDSWVDVARRETEVEILEELNQLEEAELCTEDGVRVIPKIVAHEIVKTHQPGPVEGSKILVNDTTSIFRREFVETKDGKEKWAWTSMDKTDKTEIRLHYRVVMTPFGSKLEMFKNRKGLMLAFSDIVHAIRILHTAGILHRDISFRNILLYEHKDELRGLLIDYDYAVRMDRLTSEAIADRTGTLPFMAIDRMDSNPRFLHSYFHDLESLFYVLCWLFTVFEGPCDTRRNFSEDTVLYRDTSAAIWNGDVPGSNTIQAIHNSKHAQAADARGFEQTVKQFADYFQHMSNMMEELRELLYESQDSTDKKKASMEQKKKMLEAVLQNCKSPLESPERVALINNFTEIAIHMRPPEIVLDSFTLLFKNMKKNLPEEKPVQAKKADGGAKHNGGGPRPRPAREFFDRISPGAVQDVERGDEVEEVNFLEGRPSSAPAPTYSVGRSSTLVNPRSYSNKRKSMEDHEPEAPSSKRSKSRAPSTRKSNTASGKMPSLSFSNNHHSGPGKPNTSFNFTEPAPKTSRRPGLRSSTGTIHEEMK
ncbi:hypothetical protein SCHPADRAFT_924849 [Schizopora paradoxa]|uniref:Protein kinase domain-containing protein n=1 Tax=Schizopora paradoxa TaxID=27342 RepID=A0A0H2SNV7_9AGAM|nr:hypothetical protein SCHPADRAFT_924849 [Schizopora paradoxa]